MDDATLSLLSDIRDALRALNATIRVATVAHVAATRQRPVEAALTEVEQIEERLGLINEMGD